MNDRRVWGPRCSLLAACVLFVCWRYWQSGSEVTAVVPNPFCELADLKLVADGSVIPFNFRAQPKTGFYVTIDLRPKSDRPSWIGDHKFVETPSLWQTAATCQPVAEYGSENQKSSLVFQYFPGDRISALSVATPDERQRQVGGFILSGSVYAGSGFFGPPERPSKMDESENLRWAFICPPHDAAIGDKFVIELSVLPHGHWISKYRAETGPSIVIWRGMMEIAVDGSYGNELDDASKAKQKRPPFSRRR